MDIAFDFSTIGSTLWIAGRQNEGFEYFRKSLAIRERLSEGDPKDYRLRDRLAWMRANLGDLLSKSGKHAEAVPYWRAALETRRLAPGIYAGDFGQWQVAAGLARSLDALGRINEACGYWREAKTARAPTPVKPDELAEVERNAGRCRD